MTRSKTPPVQDKVSQYLRAAQKGADWIESNQSSDGSLGSEPGLGPIYKTTYALVMTGRLDAAWRLMDHITARYMPEPGVFRAAGESKLDQDGVFYRTCYILRAALCLGRFDVASPAALSHLYRYQHRSGGFCGGLRPAARRRINPLDTCMGGWLCLYTARLDRAIRAGDFLVRLIRNQPRMPERLYFHTDSRTGRCVTAFDPGTDVCYYSDRKKDKQWFFVTGAIMGFLADLFRATGNRSYLRTATKLFAYEKGMHPRSFEWPCKCKVGWGAALLYSVTGDAMHRTMATKVADVTLLGPQCRNGGWKTLWFPLSDDGEGFDVSAMELTAEFTFELCEIAKALSRVASRR